MMSRPLSKDFSEEVAGIFNCENKGLLTEEPAAVSYTTRTRTSSCGTPRLSPIPVHPKARGSPVTIIPKSPAFFSLDAVTDVSGTLKRLGSERVSPVPPIVSDAGTRRFTRTPTLGSLEKKTFTAELGVTDKKWEEHPSDVVIRLCLSKDEISPDNADWREQLGKPAVFSSKVYLLFTFDNKNY